MRNLTSFLAFKNPPPDKIPDIPLYMDQLVDYYQTHLGCITRECEDNVFTKTMINNYVKSKVIEPPHKKKYSKNAITELILVYHLKQAFSIQDTYDIIKELKIQANEDYYTDFSETFDRIKEDMIQAMPLSVADLTVEKARELMIQLSIEAAIKKRLSEQLLDHISKKTVDNN